MADETENPEITADETEAAAPAEPAAQAEPAAPAEPEVAKTPKERRQARRAANAPAPRGPVSPEERDAERRERRRQAAKLRSAYRARQKAKRAERRAAEPPPEPHHAPEHGPGRPKVRQGVVVSGKADKTLVVRVDVTRRHRRYGKTLRSSTTLHAHDESNDANEGDTVRVVECRPMSRTKRWRLVEILERAK
jgi:small subunit ribosomal protein S17